jgi:hypothetical protein
MSRKLVAAGGSWSPAERFGGKTAKRKGEHWCIFFPDKLIKLQSSMFPGT